MRTGAPPPSVEAMVHIAEAFNVSIDYLLVEVRPPPAPARGRPGTRRPAGRHPGLSAEGGSSLLHLLDALVTKNRLKALAGERD